MQGYHNEVPKAWSALHATSAAAEPDIKWSRLRRLTLFFDDQINYPAECCRSSLGFVVAGGGDELECAASDENLQAAAAAWRRHPLVTCHGLKVALFPAGDCLAADLSCCDGPLSYFICLVRALHCLRLHVRATGVHAKVPGLLQLHSPAHRHIAFMLPLEGREELLPF